MIRISPAFKKLVGVIALALALTVALVAPSASAAARTSYPKKYDTWTYLKYFDSDYHACAYVKSKYYKPKGVVKFTLYKRDKNTHDSYWKYDDSYWKPLYYGKACWYHLQLDSHYDYKLKAYYPGWYQSKPKFKPSWDYEYISYAPGA